MKYKVTYKTYDEYYVDASDEYEAERKAYQLLKNDRTRSIANLHTDDVDIECLDEDEE